MAALYPPHSRERRSKYLTTGTGIPRAKAGALRQGPVCTAPPTVSGTFSCESHGGQVSQGPGEAGDHLTMQRFGLVMNYLAAWKDR